MQSYRRGAVYETFGRGLAASAVAGALALVPLAAFPGGAQAAGAAPVLSSTFEDGPGAWSANGDATVSVVPDPGHPGGHALLASDIQHDYDGQSIDLLALLTPGATYAISYDMRLADAGQPAGSAHFTVNDQVGTAAQGYHWVGDNTPLSADAWTTVTGTYTLPDGATKANLYLNAGGSAPYPNVLLDNVTITPEAPAATTHVISSSFEDDTTGGWTARDDGHGSATLDVVPDPADGSNHVLQATGRQSSGQGVTYDVTGKLTPGETYDFSGDLRFAAGQAPDEVWLSLANNTSDKTDYLTLGKFDTVTDSGWVHVDQQFTMPAGESAQLYLETRYSSSGAGNTSDLLFDNLQVDRVDAAVQDIEPIKDTLPFPVGAAVSDPQLTGAAGELLAKHFDQVTPENTMKVESWYDADGDFVSDNPGADALMTYAQEHHLRVYGHNLCWYQQTPAWFFNVSPTDDTPLTASDADKEILRQRLDDHIRSVAQYLSDKFGAFGSATNPLVSFDVVNEAVSDNLGDPEGLRQSRWYQVLGSEYIDDAFRDADKYFNKSSADGGFAASGSDRPIALFYNDYNTEQSGKRQRVLDLVHRLIADDVPIDGVGHQFHVTMSTPISDLRSAIETFQHIDTAASAGGHELQQAITELDVPTGTPVTPANEIDQGYYYKAVFDMLRDEYDDDADIFSATVWGLVDGQSWRASSGAPLLFGDDLQAKPAYYGVTDQDLPAKQVSAIAFQQSANDVDATSAGAAASVTGDPEWSRLPLVPVGDSAGFQVRWTNDHITAYVSSTDTTDDTADAATLQWSDGSGDTRTATVGRDGTATGGAIAKVTSTPSGWKAVVDLPLAGLTSSSTPRLDVAVTDGTRSADWNTPGTLGTLKLVEPLSFTTIPEASSAPSIDGTKDAVWAESSSVVPGKLIQGTANDTTATIHQLWRGQYLYVYAEVKDATGADQGGDSSPNAYERDSVEIFTDPGNAKNGSYRPDDAQMRLGANGTVSFGAGDSETAQAARLQSVAKRVPGGYVVEARVDLKDNTGVGTFQGLDYEINDGADGTRVADYGWAEQTGSAYQSTSRWGVAELVAAVNGGGQGGGTGGGQGGGTGGGQGGGTGGQGGGTGGHQGGSAGEHPSTHPTPVQKAKARLHHAVVAVRALKQRLEDARGPRQEAALERQLEHAQAKLAQAKQALSKAHEKAHQKAQKKAQKKAQHKRHHDTHRHGGGQR